MNAVAEGELARKDYLLDNSADEAAERFAALSELYDAVTFRHMAALGIGPGWRCWEVGAGGPSVPSWLAEQVGPTGSVLATDLDVRWCRTDASATYDVLQHDVARDEPPQDGFDLVHARLVLVHVPARAEALRRMVRSLRPGGVLLIEDFDPMLGPLACPDRAGAEHHRANRIREDFHDLLAERGVDLMFGRKLPRLLRENGLIDVGADGYVAIATDAARALEAANVRQVAAALASRGDVTQAEIDDHLRALAMAQIDVSMPPLVSTWGRKPEGEPVSYVYADGARTAELSRLRRLEAVADPETLAAFERIGVSTGWRCLEVAAGAGSIARALAERVGERGHVVATDIDTRFLASSARSNLEVRQADLLNDDVEWAAFDLVHTRHLIAHLGARSEEAIERLAAALKPGGWLVVEDVDLMPMLLPSPAPAEQRAVEATFEGFARMLRGRGGDAHIGRRLPELFERTGLTDVQVDARVPFTRGDDDETALTLATLAAVRPGLVDVGVRPEDIDLVLALMSRPEHWAFGPMQVTVVGRRPGLVAARPGT